MATIKVDQTVCDLCNKAGLENEANEICSICNKDVCHLCISNQPFLPHNNIHCENYIMMCNTVKSTTICWECYEKLVDLVDKRLYVAREKEQLIHQKYLSQLNEILNKIHKEVEEVWENTLDYINTNP